MSTQKTGKSTMDIHVPVTNEVFEASSNRFFYHKNGHFRYTYDSVHVNPQDKTVTVEWASGMKVVLGGRDAAEFLRINKSRFAQQFNQASKDAAPA